MSTNASRCNVRFISTLTTQARPNVQLTAQTRPVPPHTPPAASQTEAQTFVLQRNVRNAWDDNATHVTSSVNRWKRDVPGGQETSTDRLKRRAEVKPHSSVLKLSNISLRWLLLHWVDVCSLPYMGRENPGAGYRGRWGLGEDPLLSDGAQQSALNETLPSDWRAHERD